MIDKWNLNRNNNKNYPNIQKNLTNLIYFIINIRRLHIKDM